MPESIVLAFSGGLDTSFCIPWLREHQGGEIITVTIDVGGFDEQARAGLEERAQRLGATRHVHVDARGLFFDGVLRHLIAGNVLRGHLYPLCVGAERTLQAQEVARVAGEIGAAAVAHGCTAAGNDQVRFEIALRATAPEMEILAPIRDVEPSREEEVAYLEGLGAPLPPEGGAYSINSGLWGTTIGGVETLDTHESIPESAWVRTRGAFDSPRPQEHHTIGFQSGTPVRLDEHSLDPVSLIESLEALAADFGIGRGLHLGDTVLGAKGRVAFEAPAATTLITAHRELEKLVLTREQQRLKDRVAETYGDLVHCGHHLEPACRDIESLFQSTQARVTGEVRVLMRPGALFVEGVTSPYSLRDASAAVYGESAGEWTAADARGFARLSGLPELLHVRAGAGKEAP